MIKHVLQQGGQYIKQHFLSLKPLLHVDQLQSGLLTLNMA